MIRLNNFMPHIEYPTEWKYSVIGYDYERVRRAVEEVVPGEFSLKFSNMSSQGTYQSFLLVVTVESEEMRESLFYSLKRHKDIFHVL
ncbi:MAG: DUF493 domain-containing protein [Calditrichaeota bacterium]|nr:MAG: DUF493 domain-containing protein [Calditrichota bacterium]